MKTAVISTHAPLDIRVVEATRWSGVDLPRALTQAAPYLLVHIMSGRGHYLSKEREHAYQVGDLFFLPANDSPWFFSSQPTRFCVVRFHPDLLQGAHIAFAEVPPIFEQATFEGPPDFTMQERAFIAQQVTFCLHEYAQPQAFGRSLVRATIIGLLLLLRRAHLGPTKRLLPTSPLTPLASALVEHIRQYLKEPHQLTAAAIGLYFNHTPRYVGTYFKRRLGRGLKEFVAESRIVAIQQELRYGDKTISQLAYEYGFADESHLSKAFKAIAHQTPLHYRMAWTTLVPSVN